MTNKVLKLINFIVYIMYVRLKITLVLSLWFLTICQVSASSLGMINILSDVDEPFVALIPISPKTDLSKFNVQLADKKTFDNKGIIREDFISNIKIEIVKTKDSNNIKLSSRHPIFTNFFTILLVINDVGEKNIYSVLIDLDNPAPVASLIFGTKIGEDFVDTKNVKTQIYIEPIEKIRKNYNDIDNTKLDDVIDDNKNMNKIKKKIQQQKDKILDKNVSYNSDLAPEDKRLFKSQLYRKIIDKTPETIQDIYIPTTGNPVSVKVKSKKTISTDQERRVKLKTINEAIIHSDELSAANSPEDGIFRVAMGNPNIAESFRKTGYKNQDYFYVKILSALMLGLMLTVILMMYSIINRRKKLQQVYLGNFNNKNEYVDDTDKLYSRKFHNSIRALLNNGEFDEAKKLFRDEFLNRGMSLYALCRYYSTFQDYGIQEFNSNLFLPDNLTGFQTTHNSIYDQKNTENGQLDNSLYRGKNSSSKSNKTRSKHKGTENNKMVQDNVDLSEVAEDIITAKLNLASAYTNMKDFVKAEGILVQICRTGSPQQRKEASRLLKKIKF